MNLLLVDDHPMVRHGCACLLGEMLPQAEIRAVESGEDALVAAQQRVPDLVLLDIGLPGISGIETARRLIQRWPLLRILFFSMHDELPLVRQALATGALGYITKNASPDVLLDAVGRCLKGHRYIEQDLATQLACAGSDERLDPRLRDVTQREFEIFVMLARGVPPRQIAENLCISSKTVSNNLTVLKQKLSVSSLTELVHLAIDTGVLRVQSA
ncbi:response regulator [Halopseudomonas pachastrellae]|uniref:response regulator n=1 Tax=Halopseudomonas pachastrellae TaxID=254161 RepID=UPI003D7EEB78